MEEDKIIEALTELRTDVKYLREDIKEIKADLKAQKNQIDVQCDDCATARKLSDHIEHHGKNIGLIQWLIPTLISAAALGLVLFK